VALTDTKTLHLPLLQVTGKFEDAFKSPENQYPLKANCYP